MDIMASVETWGDPGNLREIVLFIGHQSHQSLEFKGGEEIRFSEPEASPSPTGAWKDLESNWTKWVAKV
jgi:hypothetical protein